MRLRTFFAGLTSASVATSLAGCSGTSGNDLDPESDRNGGDSSAEITETSDEYASDDSTPEDDTSESETSDRVSEPDPITLTGKGPTETDPFELIGGFVAADMEYVGYDGGSFRVRLIDHGSEDIVWELADEPDQWSGELGETLDAGSYRLDIEADGEWSIEVRQPRPTSGETPPIEDDCKISTLLGPYELDGELRVRASHEGGGNFIVRAHDATASGDEVGNLLIHETGRFEGTETFSYDGLAWITVVTDGDWEVAIE